MDPFEQARLDAMLTGYQAYWDTIDCEVLAVEQPFEIPLVDDLGIEHPRWRLAGTIDVLARVNGRVQILDHKNLSGDGSVYAKLAMLNGQVGTYFDAVPEANEFVFDVLVKPDIKPKGATPEENRYKKDGCLKARAREHDETPLEFANRCAAKIMASPADYYRQIPITRDDAKQVDHRGNLWRDAELMDYVARRSLHSANPDACFKFGHGSPCEFWQVCAGAADVHDDGLYQANEYAKDFGSNVLSNSRRSAFNQCRRKHHYLFDLKRRGRSPAKALVFGTTSHKQIEAYWRGRMRVDAAAE